MNCEALFYLQTLLKETKHKQKKKKKKKKKQQQKTTTKKTTKQYISVSSAVFVINTLRAKANRYTLNTHNISKCRLLYL